MTELGADLVFDRIFGILRCPALGKSWRAYSGKKGVTERPKSDSFHKSLTTKPPRRWGRTAKDPLPAGTYRTGALQLRMATSPRYNKAGFTDRNGFYWFLHIIRWRGGRKGIVERRSEFGIHPDGPPLGTTLGCIGLKDEDTKPIFEELKKLIEQKGEIFIDVI